MATGFIAQLDDGTPLFDANDVVYGLRKSGYMSEVAYWTRWYWRSTNLDPNDPSSYAETSGLDRIYGFSVTGAVAPIVFINGLGVAAGSSTVGGVTTFYFMGANANTKFYYFDTMRDNGPSVGIKLYSDTTPAICTFNSEQVPLNIVGAHTAPGPSAAVPGWPGLRGNVFNGATKSFYRGAGTTNDAALLISRLFVSLPAGEYAAYTTFSRSFSQGMHDNGPATISGYNPCRTQQMSGIDGAYGASNGFYWITCDAPGTSMRDFQTYGTSSYYNIPTDRMPQALVVRSDLLPFPYDVTS